MAENTQSWVGRSRDYVSEVQAEFNKITWPPQAEMISGTVSVVVIVSLIATFLGLVDFILSLGMQRVLG